jgi:hypothetical protein
MTTEPADPFRLLGVEPGASPQELRAARRRLAKMLHPDLGAGRGSEAMAQINTAFEEASAHVPPPASDPLLEAVFEVDALPAETCELLIVACRILGEVLAVDEPYRLEAYLDAPSPCFCVFSLVPQAGGSIVTMSVEAADAAGGPSVDAVRDAVVDELIRLTRPATR